MSYTRFPASQKHFTRGIASVQALGRRQKRPAVLQAWGTGCHHSNAATNIPDLSLSTVTGRARNVAPGPLNFQGGVTA